MEIIFSIDSEQLKSLKQNFAKAASEIKDALREGRPIILRHHADCDGYCAAFALETAILPFINEAHKFSTRRLYYKRIPMRTPYYSYSDALKDMLFIDSEKSWIKPPLVILADLSPLSNFIVQHMKLNSLRLVVIDHHAVEVSSELLDAEINPTKQGFDGSLSTGMLAFELSLIVNPSIQENFLLPALAGVADKSSSQELRTYISLLGADEYSIKKIAASIDFLAYHLGQVEGRAIIERFFNDSNYRAELLGILAPEIENKLKTALESALSRLKEERIMRGSSEIILALFSVDSSQEYPPAGKLAGIVFEELKKKNKEVILLAVGEDSIIVRSNLPSFDLNKTISKIKQRFDGIEGGGHPSAGTIRFPKRHLDKIINYIRQLISEAE
ncbi:MAG: DHH family phosphoesterase [Candidatus Woesearchaeota archaeon]